MTSVGLGERNSEFRSTKPMGCWLFHYSAEWEKKQCSHDWPQMHATKVAGEPPLPPTIGRGKKRRQVQPPWIGEQPFGGNHVANLQVTCLWWASHGEAETLWVLEIHSGYILSENIEKTPDSFTSQEYFSYPAANFEHAEYKSKKIIYI